MYIHIPPANYMYIRGSYMPVRTLQLICWKLKNWACMHIHKSWNRFSHTRDFLVTFDKHIYLPPANYVPTLTCIHYQLTTYMPPLQQTTYINRHIDVTHVTPSNARFVVWIRLILALRGPCIGWREGLVIPGYQPIRKEVSLIALTLEERHSTSDIKCSTNQRGRHH